MKKKQLLILLAVFVGVFAITKGLEFVNREQGQLKVRQVAKVNTARVDRIELTNQGEVIVLQKSGELWGVTAPVVDEANQAFVQSLLASLGELKSDNIVATNPENQASYQVDEAQGTRVLAFAGESELANLIIGKLSSDGNFTYIRPQGSNEIHAVRGSIRSIYVRSLTEWRDRNILSISRDVVTQIDSVRANGESVSLVRNEDSWQLRGEEGAVNTSVVDALLGQTSLLTASGFVDDVAAAGIALDAPTLTVTLTDQTGQTVGLLLYASAEDYYLKLAEGDQLFKIGSFVFDTFDLSREALLATEETQTTPSDVVL